MARTIIMLTHVSAMGLAFIRVRFDDVNLMMYDVDLMIDQHVVIRSNNCESGPMERFAARGSGSRLPTLPPIPTSSLYGSFMAFELRKVQKIRQCLLCCAKGATCSYGPFCTALWRVTELLALWRMGRKRHTSWRSYTCYILRYDRLRVCASETRKRNHRISLVDKSGLLDITTLHKMAVRVGLRRLQLAMRAINA